MSDDEEKVPAPDQPEDRKAKKPMPTTHGLPVPELLRIKPKSGGMVQTRELAVRGRKLELTDAEFIGKFAAPADLPELRKLLEARMEDRPKPPFYYRCSSPECSWVMKAIRQLEEGTSCLKCNRRQVKGGGILQPMTSKKEIMAHEAQVLANIQETARVAKKMAAAAAQAWRQRVASGEFGR